MGLSNIDEQAKLTALLEKIDELGARYLVELHEVNTKKLTNDLFEIKVGRNRFLYSYRKDNMVHVVHAFRKSTQKTSSRHLKLAMKRIRDMS